MIRIRAFREEDGEEVAALWREAFPEPPRWNHPETDIARKFEAQPDLFFVAMDVHRVVGAVMAGWDGHRGWVYYLAVCHSHRRRGIGSRLIRHAESALTALGCPKINLQVRASNRSVVAFYETLGYRIEDHVSMGRPLSPADPP